MLLSHTAGLTQEARIGNNNELDPGSFDAHVSSITDTWLRFPVGTGYAYSNPGIDLAGYILQRVQRKPFLEVECPERGMSVESLQPSIGNRATQAVASVGPTRIARQI